MTVGVPWYKRSPATFLAAAASAPLELLGAYNILIDTIFLYDRPLPDNEDYVAGLLKVSKRKWRTLRKALLEQEMITVVDGQIDTDDARSQREDRSKLMGNRAEAGRRGGQRSGEQRKINALSKANASSKPEETRQEERRRETPPNPPYGGHEANSHCWDEFKEKWAASDVCQQGVEDAFHDLSVADQKAAVAGIGPYLSEVAALERKRCGARRYIRERRWVGLKPVVRTRSPSRGVLLHPLQQSAQWAAWIARYRVLVEQEASLVPDEVLDPTITSYAEQVRLMETRAETGRPIRVASDWPPA